MRLIGHRWTIGALTGLLFLGWSRTSVAQTADTAAVVTVETIDIQLYRAKQPTAVPAAKSETKSRYPGGNAKWVPGFWTLAGNRNSGATAGWVWVPGAWVTPPARNARWEPAHWGMYDEWWSWIPGHWIVPGKFGYPADYSTAKMARLKESQEDQE